MRKSPFEVRRWLPAATLSPLDLLLESYDRRVRQVTILQVGACDGSTNDPIRHLVSQGHARAILLEPNPFAFARLQEAYAGLPNVTLVQAALAEQDGEADFYRVRQTAEPDAEVDLTLQIASFYREHLEQHGKKAHEIERITVPCRSLASLVEEFGLHSIDLLQVDAEGFDAAVVRMALQLAQPPEAINFEHVHLKRADRQPLFASLAENGYRLGYDMWNILAVRAAHTLAADTGVLPS